MLTTIFSAITVTKRRILSASVTKMRPWENTDGITRIEGDGAAKLNPWLAIDLKGGTVGFELHLHGASLTYTHAAGGGINLHAVKLVQALEPHNLKAPVVDIRRLIAAPLARLSQGATRNKERRAYVRNRTKSGWEATHDRRNKLRPRLANLKQWSE